MTPVAHHNSYFLYFQICRSICQNTEINGAGASLTRETEHTNKHCFIKFGQFRSVVCDTYTSYTGSRFVMCYLSRALFMYYEDAI